MSMVNAIRPAGALVALAGALMLAGCASRIDTRGNFADAEALGQITPGESTRGTVADLLGSPTSVATFDDKTWYYIGRRTERVAFFKPELMDQQVVAVQFDDAGVVEEVKVYDTADAQEIELVGRTTPTSGKELNVFQQLFSNIGRFNTEGTSPAVPGGRVPTPYP
jgi:outer membrane protein assembly factor BamE (lipoprotein component of BamABCDE complex)